MLVFCITRPNSSVFLFYLSFSLFFLYAGGGVSGATKPLFCVGRSVVQKRNRQYIFGRGKLEKKEQNTKNIRSNESTRFLHFSHILYFSLFFKLFFCTWPARHNTDFWPDVWDFVFLTGLLIGFLEFCIFLGGNFLNLWRIFEVIFGGFLRTFYIVFSTVLAYFVGGFLTYFYWIFFGIYFFRQDVFRTRLYFILFLCTWPARQNHCSCPGGCATS